MILVERLHAAQIENAPPEAPRAIGRRQSHQPIGDLRLLRDAARASPLACEGLPPQIGAQLREDVPIILAQVLLLQLFHPRHSRDVHATFW